MQVPPYPAGGDGHQALLGIVNSSTYSPEPRTTPPPTLRAVRESLSGSKAVGGFAGTAPSHTPDFPSSHQPHFPEEEPLNIGGFASVSQCVK